MSEFENIMIFEINGQLFGYPTKKIKENVTIEKIYSIPKAPYYIKGMFNLRNNPIPLIDTGVLLFNHEVNSNVVIVISNKNSIAGILVNRLKGVVNIDKSKIIIGENLDLEGIDKDFIQGYFEYKESIIFLLKFDSLFNVEKMDKKRKHIYSEKEDSKKEKSSSITDGYIIFKILEEWFAIEVKYVSEILSYPENISTIPENPDYITGLFLLRNESILLIDLARYLNIHDNNERDRVILVNIKDKKFGLAVPFVKEIKWIEKDKILPLDNDSIKNKGIISLDNGKRLVLILDIEKIFANEEGHIPEDKTNESTQEEIMGKINKYLHFKIGEVNLAINIKDVQEVVEFQTINKLPKAPYYILGMINLRNSVISVLSLAKLLDIEENEEDIENKRLIVIDGSAVSFLVDKLEGILSFKDEEIQPPDNDMDIEEKYLEGIAKKDENHLIFIINVKNILKKNEFSNK